MQYDEPKHTGQRCYSWGDWASPTSKYSLKYHINASQFASQSLANTALVTINESLKKVTIELLYLNEAGYVITQRTSVGANPKLQELLTIEQVKG